MCGTQQATVARFAAATLAARVDVVVLKERARRGTSGFGNQRASTIKMSPLVLPATSWSS